jgi:uncharacterized membrane protein YfcA
LYTCQMWYYLTLLGAGVFAGFINVTSGGGSLITLPLLVLTGMPSAAANGTSRIAVLLQNIFAAGNFRRHGRRDLRQGIFLGLAAVPGAVAGSLIAVNLSEQVFKALLACVILLGLAVVVFHKPAEQSGVKLKNKWLMALQFVFIGFFGGLIQAGTGFLIIFSLTMIGGLGLAATNSLKVIIIAVYIIPSLIVFGLDGNIEIIPGLLLAAGSSIGGVLGSNFSQKMSSGWIKLILAVALVGMAAKLFIR